MRHGHPLRGLGVLSGGLAVDDTPGDKV